MITNLIENTEVKKKCQYWISKECMFKIQEGNCPTDCPVYLSIERVLEDLEGFKEAVFADMYNRCDFSEERINKIKEIYKLGNK